MITVILYSSNNDVGFFVPVAIQQLYSATRIWWNESNAEWFHSLCGVTDKSQRNRNESNILCDTYC